jgi:2-polyprenyl-3-methyl-5-hydroxy-6-metoxy-1,4-benzoquinol methylase
MSTGTSLLRCHVCAGPGVQLFSKYEQLCRVTSDCKPWPRGGRLGACTFCGTVQKPIDAAWQAEVAQIYREYTIYHQSNGAEQAVFDTASGRSSLRSQRLVEMVSARLQLPTTGRLLDLGCGNGAFLRAFSAAQARWALAGLELDDKYRETVESIPRVEALHAGDPKDVPGKFDFISLIHALEHIPNPRGYLEQTWNKLKVGGLMLVEIPNFLENPFDLLVADHSSHFTPTAVKEVVHSTGFEVLFVATDWVVKEQTVIARKVGEDAVKHNMKGASGAAAAGRAVGWLLSVVEAAQEQAGRGRFGLFGTSITATWLTGELGEAVQFFVDEDPNRVGKTFMERPVYHPSQVPGDSNVFLGLPRQLAESVKQRIGKPGVSYHLPPPFDTAAKAA